jgi:hypothetical protein
MELSADTLRMRRCRGALLIRLPRFVEQSGSEKVVHGFDGFAESRLNALYSGFVLMLMAMVFLPVGSPI